MGDFEVKNICLRFLTIILYWISCLWKDCENFCVVRFIVRSQMFKKSFIMYIHMVDSFAAAEFNCILLLNTMTSSLLLTALYNVSWIFIFLIIICWHEIAGGGVWAVHWFVFSVSYTFGIFHYILTAILAASTLSTFSLSAFRCAGTPPTVLWGSYPVVGKGDLENYTFCHYCAKPKSPRAHHCRSCRTCVLDMDHHCPFVSIDHILESVDAKCTVNKKVSQSIQY